MSVQLDDRALEHLRSAIATPQPFDDRYELGERLGAGGMGVVYAALDRELGRTVAVKVLAPECSDPEAEARLLREARIMARLEHPGIVPVHDLGRLADGRIYYVMKRIHGLRLDEWARQHPALRDRLRVFERLAETIAFAHAHGVLHRDLKPGNVMIGSFGEVLVLDWGIAKVAARDSSEPLVHAAHPAGAAPLAAEATRGGAILGTPAYMSPEQAAGRSAAADERSDVFGLGAILHYLVRDRAPAEGPDPVGARPAGEPRALAAILRKALAPQPSLRYASSSAVIDDVRRFQAAEPVAAYPESWLGRGLRLARKYQAALWLLLGYLLMRAALIFWSGR